VTSIRAVCALALVTAVALAGATTPAPAAKPPPKPKPGQLWNKFPLGKQQPKGTTPAKRVPTRTTPRPSHKDPRPAPTATSPSRSSGLPDTWTLVLVAAVLLLGVEALIVMRVYRREDGPSEEEVRTSLVTIKDAAARLESRRKARGVEEQHSKWHNFILRRKRGAGMTDQLEESVETATSDAESRVNHVDLGHRVSGVIKAAEDVAEQIRADALEDAALIKQRAEEAAVKAIRQAAKERDELRATSEAAAETMRIESENYATGLRCDAEAEVATALVEGEAQARALREAAEQMARKVEASALRRREEIEEGSRGAESQLRRFQLGLASITEHLDQLLEPRGERAETLEEALTVNGGQRNKS